MANSNSKKIVRISRAEKKPVQKKEEKVVDEVEKLSLIGKIKAGIVSLLKKLMSLINRNKIQTIIIVAILVGLGWFGNEYMNTKDQIKQLTNPKTAGQTEAQIITNEVSRIIDLPTGEEPTVATVSDITKLKSQAFFKNAQNGDKVLVYPKAGKALLYRPGEKKVIEYSNINLQSAQDTTQQSNPTTAPTTTTPQATTPQPQTTPAKKQ